MTKKEKKIETVVNELKLNNEKSFTYKQLTEIARRSKADVVDVMYYLRYMRS